MEIPEYVTHLAVSDANTLKLLPELETRCSINELRYFIEVDGGTSYLWWDGWRWCPVFTMAVSLDPFPVIMSVDALIDYNNPFNKIVGGI